MKTIARFFAPLLILIAFIFPLQAMAALPLSSPTFNFAGGGHIMKTDDMSLVISKMASLDGTNFVTSSAKINPFSLAENKSSVVYFKVMVTNLADYTASKIYLDHYFDSALSDMVAGNVQLISGDARYNKRYNRFIIDRLLVGSSATFTYSVTVHENGQSAERAVDVLTLANVDSNLPITQDSLTYVGVGKTYETYLVADALFNLNDSLNSANSGNGDDLTDGNGGGGNGGANGAGGGLGGANANPNLVGNVVRSPFLTASGSSVWAILLFSGLMAFGYNRRRVLFC